MDTTPTRAQLFYRWIRQRWAKQEPIAPVEPDPDDHPTPIYVSHRLRLIILFAIVLLIGLVMRQVPNIMNIVFLGATLALILSFPVRLLQYIMPRGAAIIVVTFTLLGGAVASLVLLIPFLITEIARFVDNMPTIMESITTFAEERLQNMYRRGWIDQQPSELLEDLRSGLLDSTQTILVSGLDNIAATLGASVNVMVSMFGMIFVAVYLLVDIPDFKKAYIRMWAPVYRPDALALWDTIGYSLSRYLSTQVLSLAIQGAIAFVGLWILGVPYALILGLVQSVTAILPFVGAWLAFIPAAIVAATISWQMVVGVAILYFALNQIEGNLITPNLQGNAVKVHPILIFMGVIGGAQIFGVMGAVLAVPAIAVIRVVAEFFFVRLRVESDRTTLLSIMRSDVVDERIEAQSSVADAVEAEDPTAEEIAAIVTEEDGDAEAAADAVEEGADDLTSPDTTRE